MAKAIKQGASVLAGAIKVLDEHFADEELSDCAEVLEAITVLRGKEEILRQWAADVRAGRATPL